MKNEFKARDEAEKTVIKALALGSGHGGGGLTAVDVKNGKIVRIRPLHYDWKHTKEEFIDICQMVCHLLSLRGQPVTVSVH